MLDAGKLGFDFNVVKFSWCRSNGAVVEIRRKSPPNRPVESVSSLSNLGGTKITVSQERNDAWQGREGDKIKALTYQSFLRLFRRQAPTLVEDEDSSARWFT